MATQDTVSIEDTKEQIESLGQSIRQKKQNKEDVRADVEQLNTLKATLEKHEPKTADDERKITRNKYNRAELEQVLTRRMFYVQSFGIYGGVAGLYDLGPPGCALQANILNFWRQFFVLEEDMLELDCSILTPYDVLKTSGHVDKFTDLMCKDSKTGDFFRVDHLIENTLEDRLQSHQEFCEQAQNANKAAKKKGKNEPVQLDETTRAQYEKILAQIDGYTLEEYSDIVKKYNIKAPVTGNDVTEPVNFNLMFATSIGPTGQSTAFLRPETAQGQFLNFKRLFDFNNEQMPFASAQIGRSFRNEISPRSGLLRVREFTMAEIEHFVHPDRKEHKKFKDVENDILNLRSKEIQLEGKVDYIKMTLKEAVSKNIIANETLAYFLGRVNLFLKKIGIKADRLRFRQHMQNEMAHYAKDCWDAEIHTSYGWVECVGCADRSAFDLTRHSERTNEKLVVRESLPEGQSYFVNALSLNRKVFGPAFKKDAKKVSDKLERMDSESLEKVKDALEKEQKYNLEIDGAAYTVTNDMISIQKEEKFVREYTPNVIEPSFGIGRILYALLEHSWWQRPLNNADTNDKAVPSVFSFPPTIAPIKCLIVPLSQSQKAEFDPHVTRVASLLRHEGISSRVDATSSSIGRRYARNDEMGIPFGITIDFETLKDGTVTLRERDTTRQIRANLDQVINELKLLLSESIAWADLEKKYTVIRE